MRILYVAMKYDYGRTNQGLSFEHCNFYDSLLHMGHDIIYFDFMTILQEHGRDWMNARLLEVAKVEKPDMMFTVLFADEFDQAVIRELTEDVGILTVNWFCDDHWRFENYSRLWAPCFRWVVTTAESAIPKYATIGYRNVIKSQWACNTFMYQRMSLPLVHDVTFVGQPYGSRRTVIDQIRKAGIHVQVWGSGWESGRASQEEMIQIFNQSRINLNLTTAYGLSGEQEFISPTAPYSLAARLLDRVPFVRRVGAIGRARLRVKRLCEAALVSTDCVASPAVVRSEQIKGRNFEVPGCGGFLLTGIADDLGEYYDIGKEVVCFNNADEMVEKIQRYLVQEDERMAIAQAGYERTLRDHTYERRFMDIFARMGLVEGMACITAGQTVQPGHTEEIQ